jgi:hypothetical protein
MQRRTLVPLAVLALAILGVAAAVTSAAGTVQTKIKGGPGEGVGIYKVSGGKMLPVNGQITAPSTFKCNTSNLIVKAKSIPLQGGKMNYVGPAYVDKFRAPKVLGTLTWKGKPTSGTIRFKTKKTVKVKPGGFTVVSKTCDTGTLKYVPFKPGLVVD